MKAFVLSTAAGAAMLTALASAPQVEAQGPMMPPRGAPAMPYGAMPHMGAPAMGMPMVPGMHRHGGMHPLAALGLSQEQLNKLEDIARQARAYSADAMKKIGEESAKLRSMIAKAAPDADEIGAVYRNIFDFQRQAIEQAIRYYNEQLAVLNPEQLEKWNAMRAQMMARFLPPAHAKGEN